MQKQELTGGWLTFFKVWSMAPVPTAMGIMAILALSTFQTFGFVFFSICLAFGWWSFRIAHRNFHRLGVEGVTPKHVVIGIAMTVFMIVLWRCLQIWWLPYIRSGRSASTDQHYEMPFMFASMVPFAIQTVATQLRNRPQGKQ